MCDHQASQEVINQSNVEKNKQHGGKRVPNQHLNFTQSNKYKHGEYKNSHQHFRLDQFFMRQSIQC